MLERFVIFHSSVNPSQTVLSRYQTRRTVSVRPAKIRFCLFEPHGNEGSARQHMRESTCGGPQIDYLQSFNIEEYAAFVLFGSFFLNALCLSLRMSI